MNNELNDYFMKPTIMNNGLKVYPIKMLDYERFKTLASEYILLDMKRKNNLYRQRFERLKKDGFIDKSEKYIALNQESLFLWLVGIIEQERNTISFKQYVDSLEDDIKNKVLEENKYNEAYSIERFNKEKEILELMNMVLGANVVFRNGVFEVYSDGKLIGDINEDNFYEFRGIVMKSNLLFEPRIAPNIKSQEAIDREIKKQFGDSETSLESLVAFVTTGLGGIDIGHYTYYRLRADYTAIMNKLKYVTTSMFISGGAKTKDGGELEMPNMLEPFYLKEDIYKNITRKATTNKLDEFLSR